MPEFTYGAFAFTFSGGTNFSGNAPTQIQGPDRRMYVIEHQIPAREGGIVEYIGSEQSTYQFKGFVAPSQDGPAGGTAALFLSGNSYLAQSTDAATQLLLGIRGSGAQLLVIESTNSNYSGYMNLYENDFYMVESMTIAYEAGRGYPYYPYGLNLKRASPSIYGNSSGTATFSGLAGGGLSGYIFAFFLNNNSGATKGEVMNTLGVYVKTVASGNLKVAIYSGTGTLGLISGSNGLMAQSAPQAVHSGWNYFPIRPSIQTASGAVYVYAVWGDAASSSGFTLAQNDSANYINASAMSGVSFANAFPTIFNGLSGAANSGIDPDIVMVTA